MKEILVVDGYNIIYAWPELAKLKDEDLELARMKLTEEMAQYKSIRGYDKVIIVYDAHLVKGGSGSVEKNLGIEIIYTQEGIQADTVIEKLVAQSNKEVLVYVATSDWPEQQAVLGQGAVRLSARELLQEIKESRAKNMEAHQNNFKYGERQLGWRIKEEVLDLLEKIRRKK